MKPQNRARSVIYLFSEGKTNKTEKLYFHNFVNLCPYTIRFVPGNETNPEGILNFAIVYLERNTDFFRNRKDKAFIVCDVDNEEKRKRIIQEKIVDRAKKKRISFLFSNPSFEIWFLNHFKATRKPFPDGNSLTTALKKYLPNYSKNMDFFNLLQDKTKLAIKNSKFQFMDDNTGIPRSPGTKVYELVDLLISTREV